MLLTEAGLRVLVLDAGIPARPLRVLSRRMARSIRRRMLGEDALAAYDRRRQAIQSQCYAWPAAPEAFVDDIDCPYTTPPDRPFVWLRARQLGGRWLIPGHGRQYYRLSRDDFAPSDGKSPSWPLAPGELDPWYAAVERRLGLTGRRDGLSLLPDGEISVIREPTPSETFLRARISERWPNAHPVLGRTAPPFDSLERAARTGRLRIMTAAIARNIEVDQSRRVRSVVWVNHQTRREERAFAPLVFLCASALESNSAAASFLIPTTSRRPWSDLRRPRAKPNGPCSHAGRKLWTGLPIEERCQRRRSALSSSF